MSTTYELTPEQKIKLAEIDAARECLYGEGSYITVTFIPVRPSPTDEVKVYPPEVQISIFSKWRTLQHSKTLQY